MFFFSLLLALLALACDATAARQTMEEAAIDARKMIAHETVGSLMSVFQPGVPPDEALVGAPIGIMEYFADCSDDGTPTLLMLDIAPNTRNWKAGSNLTLTLRDHAWSNPLQHGRMYIIGEPVAVDRHEAKRIERCFLRQHPDSALVAPGRDVHSSAWYQFEPRSIYYFGGFGSVSWIGFIPLDLYKSAGRNQISEDSYKIQL
ncbi:pyridoxamine 5'-phosphate oxidase-domain-containing protein [Protomyces lactucae-debilis]|uniref:Pyridoxamine 5'-phosphate oxidase-domain-containing protein n=1 Tax=Protomyces lactucae-debilis TaxID=2754530 RepID=A0A1Y2FUZ7_PROLT|nr:pyridoxamine 5'-phosphate oxidase-domain-containing protein [Protomyces lactucae-debilis]ORY87789.1 pyridoxamine 5'-phosphate oxidase-domain-containing protein [Protomyces lactucae-debilis]